MPLLLKSLRQLLQFALAGALVLYLGEVGVFPYPEACRVPLDLPTTVCPEDKQIAYSGLRFVLSIFWIGFVFASIHWALGWLVAKIGAALRLKERLINGFASADALA